MSERFFTDNFIRVQKNQEKSNAAGLVMKASGPDSPRTHPTFRAAHAVLPTAGR